VEAACGSRLGWACGSGRRVSGSGERVQRRRAEGGSQGVKRREQSRRRVIYTQLERSRRAPGEEGSVLVDYGTTGKAIDKPRVAAWRSEANGED